MKEKLKTIIPEPEVSEETTKLPESSKLTAKFGEPQKKKESKEVEDETDFEKFYTKHSFDLEKLAKNPDKVKKDYEKIEKAKEKYLSELKKINEKAKKLYDEWEETTKKFAKKYKGTSTKEESVIEELPELSGENFPEELEKEK